MVRVDMRALIWPVLAIGVQTSGQTLWPAMRAFSTSIPVRLEADQIRIDVPLHDRSGRERYHFACRGGNDAYLSSLDGHWVPPLMCTLAEGTKATEESLLAEDGVAAWHTRAQFRDEQLVGACAKYPEFGLHRSFRLRGFRLSLDAHDVVLDRQNAVESFVLDVSVTTDVSAQAPQAERTGYLNPYGTGGDCNVIRRGAEPRMCRDPRTFSWMVCR